ncbi:MAG TPA: hypothetical protein VFY85_08600 [Gemmatimonadaceae bacterium]|nr:hypothetical protein [Gemmatimonadaceae bacterium]
MYEHRHQPLLSRGQFLLRLARHAAGAGLVVLASLAAGMLGYHAFEHLDWISAFLNSAMLLGGMGPVDAPRTTDGKLFAGIYALYAGLVFIVVGGFLVAPVIHRVLHRLHLEGDEAERARAPSARPGGH